MKSFWRIKFIKCNVKNIGESWIRRRKVEKSKKITKKIRKEDLKKGCMTEFFVKLQKMESWKKNEGREKVKKDRDSLHSLW